MDEKKPVVPQTLPREVYRALEDIVGQDYISEDRAVMETYSKYSIDCPGFGIPSNHHERKDCMDVFR